MLNKYIELDFSDKQKKDLKDEVLTIQHPLGNKVFEFTDDRFNPDLYNFLFDRHPSYFNEENGLRPSIILGRRGSGKSSYLNHLSHKKHIVSVSLKSWDAIDIIEEQVKLILEKHTHVDPEKVADIWHLLFLTLATRSLIKILPENKRIKEFLNFFPLKDIAKKTVNVILKEILDQVNNIIKKDNSNLSILSQSLNLGCESLDTWETMLSDIARNNDKIVIIMIDNPEKINQSIDELHETSYKDAGEARWRTYAGLLSILSRFNEGKIGVQARYCVAAEQYFFLQNRSTAILKDFSNIQILHWSSGDLLSALAHRYMLYLQLHPKNRDKRKYDILKGIEIYTRQGAFLFFKEVFENTVVNSRGYKEETIIYLLRHTQLLPRQMILYVNEAIKRALTYNNTYDLTNLEAKYIKNAIESTEELCASEIIDSYSSVFPEGRDLMNTIDNFPLIDTIASIKTNWSRLGAKKILQKYSSLSEINVDSDRFIRFLLEVGIVGIITENNNTGYINATYEYTLPQRIHPNGTDRVAIHPLFSSIVSKEKYDELGNFKGIYPLGVGLEEETSIKNKYIS